MTNPICPLGSVCEVIAGQHIPANEHNDSGIGTPYLTGPADFGETTPSVSKWTNSPRQFARSSDVLVTVKGAGVGKSNYGLDVAIGRQLMALRPKHKLLDQRYLFHWVRTSDVALNRLGQGATVPGIGKPDLENFPIPLPPLPEQRRIADILDKADDIRRKRKESIALTEELLRSAFLNIVGPGARDYPKWPSLKMEQLALDEPGSMRTGPFGSDLRHSEFVDEGVAVLGIDNAVENRFAWDQRRFITEEKYADLRRYTVKPNDVIVTIMGTTGRSAVVPQDIPLAITTKHLATITLDRAKAEPEFVSQSLHRHPEILKQIAQSNRGAIMSGLNLGLIRALEVRVPPIDTQRHFTELTAQIRQAGARTESANEDCNNLFATLVQKAFGGGL